MQTVFITDLTAFLMFLGVFLLAYASNVVFSIFQNTTVFKEHFDREKFFRGILKCVVFVIGSTLLILAIDFTVYVFDKYGLINEQIGDLVTIGSMLVTLGTASIKYIKEAFDTYVSILIVEK